MKKILNITIYTLVVMGLSIVPVFADGSPYSPYNPPHDPVPTGLIGLTDLIVTASIVLFILGQLLITVSQNLKKKLN